MKSRENLDFTIINVRILDILFSHVRFIVISLKNLNFYRNINRILMKVPQAGAGKTCLFNRYCFNSFHINTQKTIGMNFHSIKLRIQFNNKTEEEQENFVINSIFDLAGQARFRPLIKKFIDGANGALLVFDSVNISSFKELDYWYDQLIENSKDSRFPKILIGSKSDLLDKTPRIKIVSEDVINNFVKEKKLDGFFRTSALDNYNILEVFKHLTKLMLKYNNCEAIVI